MDRDVLQKMVSEYRKKIELYQSMVTEWEKELGIASIASSLGSDTENGAKKPVSSDILSLVREYQFFNKTQTEAAKALLEMVNHPLKTEDIMDAISKAGVKLGGKTPKDKKQNFYTILNRSKEFGRAGKNTWGLVAWPGITKDDKDESADEAKEKQG